MDIRKETIVRSNHVQEVHAHNLLRAHDADEQHVSLYFFIISMRLLTHHFLCRQEQHV